MYAFLMTLFIILSFFLAIFILIQQGKGDLGLGSMAGSQMLFGGSGGQGFFEKTTWVMGGIFIFGALGLTILKSKEIRSSVLEGVKADKPAATAPLAANKTMPLDVAHQAPSDDYDDDDVAAPQALAESSATKAPTPEEKAPQTT